jgi:hypothetical protein
MDEFHLSPEIITENFSLEPIFNFFLAEAVSYLVRADSILECEVLFIRFG